MYIKVKTFSESGWDIRKTQQIVYSDNSIPRGMGLSSEELLEFTWGKYPAYINEFLINKNVTDVTVYSSTIGYDSSMYRWAILDNKQAIIFTTEAYIINDDGKTIDKI